MLVIWLALIFAVWLPGCSLGFVLGGGVWFGCVGWVVGCCLHIAAVCGLFGVADCVCLVICCLFVFLFVFGDCRGLCCIVCVLGLW